MYGNALVPSSSFLIQVASLFFAVRLLRYEGRRSAATALLMVILLMAIRSSAVVYHFMTGGALLVDLFAEVIALVVSGLILFGIVFITRLIESERQTGAAAIYAETRYRLLFNQSPDGVLVLDAEGAIVDFNDRACSQLGYTREEFKKLAIPDIDPIESREQIRARLETVAREGKAEFDVKHRTKTGELRDVHVIVRTIELSGQLFHHSIWRDITERKRVEDKLVRSEQTYRTLAKNIPGIVYRVMLGPPAFILLFNRMSDEIIGYGAEELHTDEICPLEQIIVSTDRPHVDREIKRALAEKRSYLIQYHIKHKDGSLKYVVERGTPGYDTTGFPFFLDGVIFDITEQERSEQALRESEERFRDVVAAAGEYVWEVDASFKLTYLSERAAAISGYGMNDLLGRSPFDFPPSEEAARFHTHASEIARRREPLSGWEQKMLHKDGSERYLRITGTPIIRRGELFGYRGTALDITEQKQIAGELEQYRRKLEELVMKRTQELQNSVEQLVREIGERAAAEEDLKTSRLFLNSILNSIRDPLMVLDKNLHILLVNRSFEAEFMKGRNAGFLENTCHEVFYGISHSCPNCLSKETMITGKIAHRTLTRGDGEAARRSYDIFAFPLATEDGRIIGSVHHLRDVTDRKTAEETIERYQVHLRMFAHELIRTEERERRKIAQALHDGIPQKLALSKLLLQKLQSGLPPDDVSAETFARVYELYDGIAKEARTLTYELAPPVLYEVGLELALERLLENMLSGLQIDWSFENRRGGSPIRGELAPVLYAMVRELVMNVIKYAEALHLKVILAQREDVVLAEVQDDGKGMPSRAEQLNDRGQDMSGFGLFSLRERLHHLNGRLVIESGPGKGTMARIEIPSGPGGISQAGAQGPSA